MSINKCSTREVVRISGVEARVEPDRLAVEEPLEIQVASGPEGARRWKTVAITMRTPGHDRELAAGFLVGEGLLRAIGEVEAVHTLGLRQVRVTLRAGVEMDLERLQRNFYTTSSCGVCGKTSLEALEMNAFAPVVASSWRIDPQVVCALPARLREAQAVFEQTGGLHAAGLFSREGRMILVREDVGRHNAVDKVVGAEFLAGKSMANGILVVSGRASFELLQKAIAARIPMLVAVGAPSSLAVEVAEKFGVTLVGFTKASGFNIYAGRERVDVKNAIFSEATA